MTTKQVYVCIEEGSVIGTFDYLPNVPDTVTVKVVDVPCDDEQQSSRTPNYRQMLADTDWMVLRHIREKALGIQPTLSEQQYIELELQRQYASKAI